MATVDLSAQTDFGTLDVSSWIGIVPDVRTATQFGGPDAFDGLSRVSFTGTGFTYEADGTPTGGTVTGIRETVQGAPRYSVGDIAVPIARLLELAWANDTDAAFAVILGGDDRVNGSALADRIFGYAGNDTILAGAGSDIVGGDAGDDVLVGGAGIDTLVGGLGDDRLDGGEGIDTLIGEAGRDVLVGGAGNDDLFGGPDVDVALYAGPRRFSTLSGTHSGSLRVNGPEGIDDLQSVEVLSFLDGRLVYDVSDRAAVVYRMYGAAFDRAPDPLGFNGWISALEGSTTVEGMAGFFAGSPEFRSTYGALTNRGFVEQLYRNVLDREGDAGGIAYWSQQLEAGAMTRGGVLAGFSESAEHVERLRAPVEAGLWDANETASSVAKLYQAALDRAPDAGGLTYWTGAVEGGRPLADVADGFAGSAEFASAYGALSSEGYVRQLYRNVLDREADAPGVAYWTGEIASGRADRGDVLLGFSQSLEFQLKTLPLLDGGILLS